MARCHVRCRACRTRRVLPKKPTDYRNLAACPKCEKENTGDSHKCSGCGYQHLILAPKCSHCRSTSYFADKWMNGRNVKEMTCHNDCLPFPHRKGCSDCKMTADGKYKAGDPELLPGLPGDYPF